MDKSEHYPRIEIKNYENESPAFTEIYIDGQRLHGVRSYTLKHVAGNIPVLTIDLNAFNISVDEPMMLMQEGFGGMKIEFRESPEDNSQVEG